MKKTLILLMLFISVATIMTSCKKEAKVPEKQRVFQLLTSGKWYYQSDRNLPKGEPYTCFDEHDYFQFNTDSTYTETWDISLGGSYTIAEDGKSIALLMGDKEGETPITATIVISETSLKLVIDWGKGNIHEYIYSKTAGTGC